MIGTHTELYGVVAETQMSAVLSLDVLSAVLKALNVRLSAVGSAGSTVASGPGQGQDTASSAHPTHLPCAPRPFLHFQSYRRLQRLRLC